MEEYSQFTINNLTNLFRIILVMSIRAYKVEINLHKRVKKNLHERKASAVAALAAMLAVVLAGCALIPGISGSSPTSATVGTSATINNPTPASSQQSTEINLPANDDSTFVYQAIDLDVVSLVDLNGDGINEEITAIPTSSSNKYDIQVNNMTVAEDYYLNNQICLVNLDINDPYIDLAFLKVGEIICDYDFFYFDGKTLINRGTVTATTNDGCGIISDSQIGDIIFDGHGKLSVHTRSKSLCSWMLTEQWQLGPGGQLELIPEYYSLINFGYSSPDAGEPEVTLLMNLPLYTDPKAAESTLTANEGTTLRLVQSDNRQWVQVRLDNGDLAWFKLYAYEVEDFAGSIEIDSEIYYVGDVFAGLSMAG